MRLKPKNTFRKFLRANVHFLKINPDFRRLCVARIVGTGITAIAIESN